VQQLCAALIGDPAIFGPPGSATADSFLLGEPNAPFTGINGVTAGNPSLESEEADTYTLGAVFQGPGRFENLTASIDYYDIAVTGASGTCSGNAIYEQCFNENGLSNPGYSAANAFCGLIERVDGTGGPGVVRLTYLNTGFIETAGIDMAVNWGTDLPTGGRFYVNSLVTYIDHYDTQ